MGRWLRFYCDARLRGCVRGAACVSSVRASAAIKIAGGFAAGVAIGLPSFPAGMLGRAAVVGCGLGAACIVQVAAELCCWLAAAAEIERAWARGEHGCDGGVPPALRLARPHYYEVAGRRQVYRRDPEPPAYSARIRAATLPGDAELRPVQQRQPGWGVCARCGRAGLPRAGGGNSVAFAAGDEPAVFGSAPDRATFVLLCAECSAAWMRGGRPPAIKSAAGRRPN